MIEPPFERIPAKPVMRKVEIVGKIRGSRMYHISWIILLTPSSFALSITSSSTAFIALLYTIMLIVKDTQMS